MQPKLMTHFSPSEIHYIAIGTLLSLDDDDDAVCGTQGKCNNTMYKGKNECDHSLSRLLRTLITVSCRAGKGDNYSITLILRDN